MNIQIDDLRRLLFDEGKNSDEIAKIYNISSNKAKKIIKNSGLSVNKVKNCKTCKKGVHSSPPEGSGGMSFELTKD